MKFDVFGVVRRVPAADSVKQVNLYAADSNYYLTPGQDDALIEEVRALHQAIINDKDMPWQQHLPPLKHTAARTRKYPMPIPTCGLPTL